MILSYAEVVLPNSFIFLSFLMLLPLLPSSQWLLDAVTPRGPAHYGGTLARRARAGHLL